MSCDLEWDSGMAFPIRERQWEGLASLIQKEGSKLGLGPASDLVHPALVTSIAPHIAFGVKS